MVNLWEGPFFPTEARGARRLSLLSELVVAEEPSLIRSIAALLQGSDRLIEDCGSVAEALARLNTRSFDLLILDYRLPDASGLAVMDWLLSNERRESVVMISGEESLEAAIGAAAPQCRRFPAQALQRRPAAPGRKRRPGQTPARTQQPHHQQRLQSSEQMHRFMVENSWT